MLAILGAQCTIFAAWRLDYEVTETRTPPANAPAEQKGKVERMSYVLRVWLDDHAMVVEREGTKQWWNFQALTVTTTDGEKRTAERVSLLSTLGFREAEFRNRLRLGGVFGATGIKDNSFDPVFVEHLFAMRAPNSPGPERTTKGETERWMRLGKELFVIERNGPEWSTEQRRAWLRFIIYLYGLHPDIVARLEKRGKLPAEMEIGRMNIREDRFVFRLQRAVGEDLPAPPMRGNGADGDSEAAKLAAAARLGLVGYQEACARLREAFEMAQKQGRILEGTLLMLEWGLWTDQLTPEIVGQYRELMNANSECQALFSALNPKSKVEAEAAVGTLLQLESQAGEGRRAMRIFRANNLTKLGKFEEARRLFQEVLRETPANVGAWKDLGDLYYLAYEMPDAWRCWDAAKQLLPTHKNLQPVLELERRLVAENQKLL